MSSYYLLKLNHNKFNYIFFIDYKYNLKNWIQKTVIQNLFFLLFYFSYKKWLWLLLYSSWLEVQVSM